MIQQVEFTLRPRTRGLPPGHGRNRPSSARGFLRPVWSTSSSSTPAADWSICENADPDVRTDLTSIFDRLVREREPYYEHVLEGDDDMPAHAKSVLVGTGLTIPVTGGRLNLGTWQGIYLCEFRNHGGGRRIVATIYE